MMKITLRKDDVYRGYLILVNPDHLLRNAMDETRLQTVRPGIQLEETAYAQLMKTYRDIGMNNQITEVSGYRPLDEQKQLYADSLRENGLEYTRKFVALPNASEHQTGLAIDLAETKENIDMICPSFPREGICQAFRQAAIQNGFIERYKKDKTKITKISEEPWHFRYVGAPHSIIMESKGLCLEEYMDSIRQKAIDFEAYHIYYLPYDGIPITMEIGKNRHVSGDNIDGFIITEIK